MLHIFNWSHIGSCWKQLWLIHSICMLWWNKKNVVSSRNHLLLIFFLLLSWLAVCLCFDLCCCKNWSLKAVLWLFYGFVSWLWNWPVNGLTSEMKQFGWNNIQRILKKQKKMMMPCLVDIIAFSGFELLGCYVLCQIWKTPIYQSLQESLRASYCTRLELPKDPFKLDTNYSKKKYVNDWRLFIFP